MSWKTQNDRYTAIAQAIVSHCKVNILSQYKSTTKVALSGAFVRLDNLSDLEFIEIRFSNVDGTLYADAYFSKHLRRQEHKKYKVIEMAEGIKILPCKEALEEEIDEAPKLQRDMQT